MEDARRPEEAKADDAANCHFSVIQDSASDDTTTGSYTEEQREILEQGLRILARMIVRAYLRDQNEVHDSEREPLLADESDQGLGLSQQDEVAG